MVDILGQTLHFWTALVAGIFILLHVPTCNKHWASRLKPFGPYLERHQTVTLDIATIFAFVHIILSLIGLVFEVWV